MNNHYRAKRHIYKRSAEKQGHESTEPQTSPDIGMDVQNGQDISYYPVYPCNLLNNLSKTEQDCHISNFAPSRLRVRSKFKINRSAGNAHGLAERFYHHRPNCPKRRPATVENARDRRCKLKKEKRSVPAQQNNKTKTLTQKRENKNHLID